MGLKIKLKDANFTYGIGYSHNISNSSLVAYYLFNASGNIVNRVNNQTVAKVGNPTFNADSVVTNALNGFVDNNLVMSGEMTYVAIAQNSAASLIAGHVDYDAGPATSDAILYNNYFTLLNNNTTLAETVARPFAVRFVAGVISNTTRDLYVSNGGALVKTSSTKEAGNTNTLPFKIGGHSKNNVLPGNTTTYAVAVFNKALTQAEVEQVYAELKAKFPQTA